MATKFKALIGFTRMKDDELMVTAATIIGAMTDNVHFEQPTPTLESVQQLVDDFSTKLSAARRRGSPEETALKNESWNCNLKVETFYAANFCFDR